MSKVLGFPITHEGLTKLYASCLDGSHCYITDLDFRDNRFDYAVSWRNHDGEELARAVSHLARHQDGSLELHRSDVYVRHDCRGQAVNIKVLEQEIALVRKGSKHPDSRVTLEAGGMPVNGAVERLGTYTWARYGFDFADNYAHGCSKLVDYENSSRGPAGKAMQSQFRAWVNQQLLDTIGPGDIVVMDNLGSHKSIEIGRAIRARGARLWYLPAYSPDLNPIEQAFSKIKHWMRMAQRRSVDDTWRYIGQLVQTIEPDECANYIANAGYGAT